MRPRPESEWLTTDAPDLRIVEEDLWAAVQERSQKQRESAKGNTKGRLPQYVLSGLLKCAECGSNYVITKNAYYGCAAHANRGPHVCSNHRLVPRERLEKIVMDGVFTNVFAPEVLAYLSERGNTAIRSMTPEGAEQTQQAELAKARTELENIKSAIRQGITTPTTKTMLEEAEKRLADLEAFRQAPTAANKIAYLPTVVEACLRDLKATFDTDPDHARALLGRLIGQITLRREGTRLIADLQGDFVSLLGLVLDLDDQVGKPGAGSPAHTPASRFLVA